MSKVRDDDFSIVEMIVDDYDASYAFSLNGNTKVFNNEKYNGFIEGSYLHFYGYSEDDNKNLQIDKNTRIELSIHFTEKLPKEDRIGVVEKNNKDNLLIVYIFIPEASKLEFLSLNNPCLVKSIHFSASKLKYRKGLVVSFYINNKLSDI